MARYAVQTSSIEGRNFFAGAEFPQITAVKTASAEVKKYSPVVLGEDGKIAAVTAAAGDGDTVTVDTANLYGIALEDIAANEQGAVLLTGEVQSGALVLAENVDIAALEIPFRNIGIFLR